MDPDVPILDFNNPIFAIITLLLTYVLPRLVGLVSARLANSVKKTLLLGLFSVAGSALTWLADVALANSWATLDWTAFVNVIVNAVLVWAVANQVFDKIIKPSGHAEADAANGVELLKPDPKRVIEEAAAKAEDTADTIARRTASAEVVATRVAKEVVAEELAKVPRATVAQEVKATRTRAASATASKPAAKGTAKK